MNWIELTRISKNVGALKNKYADCIKDSEKCSCYDWEEFCYKKKDNSSQKYNLLLWPTRWTKKADFLNSEKSK